MTNQPTAVTLLPKVACRLRQSGLFTDAKMADELEALARSPQPPSQAGELARECAVGCNAGGQFYSSAADAWFDCPEHATTLTASDTRLREALEQIAGFSNCDGGAGRACAKIAARALQDTASPTNGGEGK